MTPKHNISMLAVLVILLTPCGDRVSAEPDMPQALVAVTARVAALSPHPDFADDRIGIIAIRQALISLQEGSGGIGACLVDEQSGKIVATGRNRQYQPYFRSDLHAEMDRLTRYEDWLRKKSGRGTGRDPRDCRGLVLVSSLEPCPMCLTRIINAGIEKLLYVAPDENGGMVHRMDQLPPFWKARSEHCEYRKARCSPDVQRLARDLFAFTRKKRKFSEEENR